MLRTATARVLEKALMIGGVWGEPDDSVADVDFCKQSSKVQTILLTLSLSMCRFS